MKKIMNTILALIITLVCSSALAADTIIVHDAWVRSAPPNAKVLAAYMEIINKSDEARALIGASSGRFGRVELHKTEMSEGMMKMIPQKRVNIPAGGSLILKPNSYHLMLMMPKSVPQVGEHVDIELQFDNGQILKIDAPVRPAKGGGMMKH